MMGERVYAERDGQLTVGNLMTLMADQIANGTIDFDTNIEIAIGMAYDESGYALATNELSSAQFQRQGEDRKVILYSGLMSGVARAHSGVDQGHCTKVSMTAEGEPQDAPVAQ